MSSTDKELGLKVHKHLLDKNIETPMVERTQDSNAIRHSIEGNMQHVMQALGMDLHDDSLVKTPHRVAKMFANEIFYGLDYANFPRCMAIENKMQADEMILCKNVLVRSMCEHHFVPFIGVAHVGYLPKNKVVGLSKINRIVDFFCRRPQVQERLNEQIAATLAYVLETDDVAVVIEAAHYCIKLRGVQDPHSSTSTSKMLGRFKSVPEARAEFFSLVGGNNA